MSKINIQLKQSDNSVMGVLPELVLGGMRPAQLELFKLISACVKHNEPLKLDLVASIYFNLVRNPEKEYNFHPAHRDHPIWMAKNKDVWELMKEPQWWRYRESAEKSVIGWLKLNIGTLAIRGFLCTIPTFDYELVKNVQL